MKYSFAKSGASRTDKITFILSKRGYKIKPRSLGQIQSLMMADPDLARELKQHVANY